jgi:hypothetical protein
MTALNPRAHLRASTERMHSQLVNDLNALPEDKAGVSPGGVARPAIEFVVECGGLNMMVSTLLTGGEFKRRTPEERKAFYATFTTREQALAFLDQQTQGLLTTLDGLDENTLGDMIDGPIGPMTRFALAQLPAMHMMYHDGQLNYLQALHGDDKMHW